MRGNTEGDEISGLDARPAETQVGTDLARKPGQYICSANIRKQPDRGLRHGKKRSLRRDPMRAVNGDAKTASHDDAVDHGNIWFTVGFDPAVHSIFVANEIPRHPAFGPALL